MRKGYWKERCRSNIYIRLIKPQDILENAKSLFSERKLFKNYAQYSIDAKFTEFSKVLERKVIIT